MISTSNSDSLVRLSKRFNEDFYNGEMILVEDTIVSLAMRRFKFDLDDKLKGNVNILTPNRFEKTGRDVIAACHSNIDEMTQKSKD